MTGRRRTACFLQIVPGVFSTEVVTGMWHALGGQFCRLRQKLVASGAKRASSGRVEAASSRKRSPIDNWPFSVALQLNPSFAFTMSHPCRVQFRRDAPPRAARAFSAACPGLVCFAPSALKNKEATGKRKHTGLPAPSGLLSKKSAQICGICG